MKWDYSYIRFGTNASENAKLLENRDYHTFCVIHDCFGTHHPETLAGIAARGEIFPVNPAWPCCMGEKWYKTASALLSPEFFRDAYGRLPKKLV